MNLLPFEVGSWAYLVGLLGILPWFLSFFNRNSKSIFDSYVHFIHAPLGEGKTSVVMQYANDIMMDKKLNDWTVFTTFYAENTVPFDLRLGVWPNVPKALIIIDEYLLLESNDMIPLEILSLGATLARQLQQQVIIISQHARLAKRHQKFQGTVGAFFVIRSFRLPFNLGRFAMMRKSAEPFIRRPKGYKAGGQRTFFKWIRASTFSTYISRKIYGYTCNMRGEWLHEANEKLIGMDDYLKRLRALAELDDLGIAAPPRAAQDAPTARPVVAGREASQGAPWFRPGGSRGGSGRGRR